MTMKLSQFVGNVCDKVYEALKPETIRKGIYKLQYTHLYIYVYIHIRIYIYGDGHKPLLRISDFVHFLLIKKKLFFSLSSLRQLYFSNI
jgi:hypothetical protein